MAADAPLRTLIVDDEPLAIERLQILCAGIDTIDLVGTASDGEAALRLIDALAPDLVLLDIAMPGLSGMEVARQLDGTVRPPAIIFCTAFDQFAVAAFDGTAAGRRPTIPTKADAPAATADSLTTLSPSATSASDDGRAPGYSPLLSHSPVIPVAMALASPRFGFCS